MPTRADGMTAPTHQAFNSKMLAFLLPTLLTGMGAIFLFQPNRSDTSELENRKLAALPDFSWPSVLSGQYTRDLDRYVADHFSFRDVFVEVAFAIERAQGMRSDEPMMYATGAGSLEELERPDDWAAPEDLGVQEADPEGGPVGMASDPTDDVLAFSDPRGADEELELALGPPVGADDSPVAEDLEGDPPGLSAVFATPARGGHVVKRNGVLVYQGRALQMFGGSVGAARAYAAILSRYAAALPPQVRLYAMIIPTPAAFYLPAGMNRLEAERRNIDHAYSALPPRIRSVDVLSEFSRYTDEYLYLRTDHHWAGRGAYHAYRAFCTVAGVKAVDLGNMTRKVKHGFLGTLYWHTRDASLREKPDDVEYFLPTTTYTAKRYLKQDLGRSVPTRYVNEASGGYGVFLGADYPLMVADTSLKNGRRVLLIKNSYGNPFAVFLLNSFERVVVVDYRYYQGAVYDLIAREGITDVVFLNGAFSANTRYHRNRIGRVLYGGKSPQVVLPSGATSTQTEVH